MSETEIEFFIPGLPAPGGSKSGFAHKVGGRYTGKVMMTESCKRTKGWRALVASVAERYMHAHKTAPLTGPLAVEFEFTLPRPKGHFGTGANAGQVKATAPQYPTVKPDTTKLIRSTEDALKGIAWGDDSLIVHQTGAKVYGPIPGCNVRIRTL